MSREQGAGASVRLGRQAGLGRFGRRGLGLLAAVAVGALGCTAGCAPGHPAGAPAAASAAAASTGPGRVPARSLPAPALVPGSQLTGPAAFEGPVRRLPVNGIEVGYRQFGAGPDLVMVMGDTTAMSLWTVDLLTRLARHFRVTIFDNRGVGYSTENPAQPMTIPLMADDTAGLIRALGLVAPILLGWSMGGEIGLTVVTRHPGLLSRLITSGADAGGPRTVQADPRVQRVLEDPDTTPAQVLDLLFPALAAAAKRGFIGQYVLVPQQAASPRVLREQNAAERAFAADERTWAALPAIRIPVLVTDGAEDVVVPPANATMLTARIPGATLDLVEGAGHGMPFQDAAGFAATVVAFSR